VTHASLSRSLVSSRFIISQRRRYERDGKERESLRDEFDRSIERERERERSIISLIVYISYFRYILSPPFVIRDF
jgi:hypothetical protein